MSQDVEYLRGGFLVVSHFGFVCFFDLVFEPGLQSFALSGFAGVWPSYSVDGQAKSERRRLGRSLGLCSLARSVAKADAPQKAMGEAKNGKTGPNGSVIFNILKIHNMFLIL